jgi:hypothetical protein
MELGDGVKFGEDLNSEQGSLIDDEDALEFSGVSSKTWVRMMVVRVVREGLLVWTSSSEAIWR